MQEVQAAASCLTDSPVNSGEEDDLRAEDYARALALFIKKAATPVTIGIQGGWGSGKTSLITLLKNMLDSDPDHPAMCVLVNAWEHSLLQNPENRAEVALSLLEGLSEGLAEAMKNSPWLDKSTRETVSEDSTTISKTMGVLKMGAMFTGKVAIQMLSNMVGGGDVSNVKMDEAAENMSALPKMSKSVRQLRDTLKTMVEKIKWKDKPVKIVFFIDDLDRVPPATAVEILDITKNIFDMPQCVFVLAIDYEVIVKGLEKKFGRKTKANEREFRQYFDKIIQIPFTMPLGAYGDNISDLLNSAFCNLGYISEDESNEIMKRLAEDAKLATGGLPRSIKRVLNTLSLLQHISEAKLKKTQSGGEMGLPPDIETRFIIVALHVNFPEIASKLMERPDFTQWDPQSLDAAWNLNLESHKEELALLDADNLFNDPWEKVVYCLSYSSPWLKSMARNLSTLLNRLLESLGGDVDNATSMPEEGLMKLKTILKGISVVSVDQIAESGLNFNNKDMERHPANQFFIKLQNALAEKLPSVSGHGEETLNITDEGTYFYAYDFTDAPKMVYASYDWLPDENMLFAYVVGKKPGARAKCEAIVDKMAKGYNWDWEGSNFYYYFSMPFTRNDFLKTDRIPEIAEKTAELYKAVEKAQKKLFD